MLGDGCSAPCPDKVVVPDEGAMGVDGSMAITLGTQSFVLVKFLFLLLFLLFCFYFFIQAYKSNLESGLPLGTCYCHL